MSTTEANRSSAEHEGRVPRSWRSKWRYVAMYWVVQAVATHVAAATLLSTDSSFSLHDLWRALSDSGVLIVSGAVAAIVSIMQAVLLFPIRRPREHGLHPGLRFLHCAAVGLVMAALSWLALWPCDYLLEEVLHTGSWFVHFVSGPSSLSIPFGVFGITLVLMWMFGQNGVPVLASAIIAAAGSAALLGGLATVLWSIARIMEKASNGTPIRNNRFEQATLGSAAGVVLIAWIAGTPLILSFMRRGEPERKLSRICACLFLGTIVEAAAAIPMDVMIRKRTDCYCSEGTFWTLTICWAFGSLTLGPVIFLVPFSRRRKRWYTGHCEVCGYDMHGCMHADRCPECGSGWKPAKAID
jgi:hypothetical protein